MDTKVSPYDLPPIEDAKRQYVELFGSALVMNTYLKIALLCVSIVALGLLVLNFRTVKKYESVKPLVIRIDDVGRGQAPPGKTIRIEPQAHRVLALAEDVDVADARDALERVLHVHVDVVAEKQ